MFKLSREEPRVGLAYSAAIPKFLRENGGTVDYVEVPFELLRHDPSVIGVREQTDVLLHCASLSIAGTSGVSATTIRQIEHWVEKTGTPWIGEHLAFVTAAREEAGAVPEPYAPGEPYNIGYTVSPPMNDHSVARIVQRITEYEPRFSVPLLIENSPLYFRVPGTTMSQAEFITAVCSSTRVGLLLDLAHWYISSRTLKFDPFTELGNLPLDRVTEIHISGVEHQADGVWDDHASAAPSVVHRLLERTLQHARPRAITLEYNWSVRFPADLLLAELDQVRRAVGKAAVAN